MFISEIECSNFRSYPEGSVFKFHAGINPVVGKNNCGKTNLIRAVDIMLKRLRQHTPLTGSAYKMDENHQISAKIPPIEKEVSEEEFHANNKNALIRFRLRFKIKDEDIEKFKKIVQPKFSIDSIELYFEVGYHKESAYAENPTAINNAHIRLFPKKINGNEKEFETINVMQKIQSEFDFDDFIRTFKDMFIVFPEFRSKPSKGKSNSKLSPEGSELPSVLYNLKNSNNVTDQNKFAEIESSFRNLVNLKFMVSEGPNLSFIDGETTISIEGVGAGIIELLNFLTHIINERGKVCIIEEPELHLHPHSKRLLMSKIKELAYDNQFIFTTHTQDLLSFDDIKKITLIRKLDGKSRILRFESLIDQSMENTLKRIIRCEQKEFLFAERILLVEGETEFGAMPVFAKKLDRDFDQNSVSVVPVEGNYFIGFMKIFLEYKIPFVALFDEDVLLYITKKIELNGKRIRTSSLIYQLDKLGLLQDVDKIEISKWEKNIIKVINQNSCNFKLSSLVASLKEVKDSKLTELLEPYKDNSNISNSESYEKSLSNDIYNFVTRKIESTNYFIKTLSPINFEGFFRERGFANILDEAKSVFGDNKVLCGRYLAEKIAKDKIPSEIADVIHVLFSLKL